MKSSACTTKSARNTQETQIHVKTEAEQQVLDGIIKFTLATASGGLAIDAFKAALVLQFGADGADRAI